MGSAQVYVQTRNLLRGKKASFKDPDIAHEVFERLDDAGYAVVLESYPKRRGIVYILRLEGIDYSG